MRRLFIWLLRIAGIVGVITAGVLLFYILFVPSIAERQIVRVLREMGMPDATVNVHCVSPRHLLISDLTLGEKAGLRIGAMNLDYETSLLGDLTVKSIDIIGAMLEVRSEDGKLDLGPLADIKTTSEEASLASDAMPFDRVSIRSSSIVLHHNGRRFALPLEATITHKQAGVCDVDATIWLLSTAIPFKGVIDLSAPDPADGAVAGDALSHGVSFTLATHIGNHVLTFTGIAGQKGTNVTAMLDEHPSGGQAHRIATANFSQSPTQGMKLVVEAEAASQPLHVALAGYEVDAQSLTANVKATFDFDALRFEGTGNLAAGQLRLATGDQVIEWKSPVFSGGFEGADENGELVIKAKSQSHVAVESMTVTSKDTPEPTMAMGPSRIDCTQGELRWPRGNDPARRPQLRVALDFLKPSVTMGDHHVALARIAPSLVATLDAEGNVSLRGKLNIADASYRNTPAKIEMLGLTLTIPFAFNDASPVDEGAIEIKSLRYGEDLLPALTGKIKIADGTLTAAAQWPWLKKNPVLLDAKIDLNKSMSGLAGISGTASARWKNVLIDDDEAVARLIKAAQLFRITGLFDMDADIEFANGTITPRIVFVASEANFAAAELDLNLRGIETTIIINSLQPLTTLPNQRLSVAKGNLGELRFTNVITNFRLDAIDAMVLELAAWRVGEQGRFWMHAAQFNPLDAVLETQVFIEDMSVSEWLQIVQDNKITGEGFLYGRIPVRVDRNRDPVLTFGEGFLYAKPRKGWVKLADRAEDRRQTYETIEQAIADLAKEAKRRLLEAVNDYEFDTLQFDFIRRNTTILCRVTTTGRGRVGAKQEIGGLVINIDNFGALLSERILRNTGSLGALDDELERLFE